MVDLSGLIDPRAVEYFEGFMNRQAEAAMAVTGAPASTWSGRYSSRTQQVKIDLGTSVATVTWAGDIEYDAKAVIQPIWLLCRRGGRLEGYRLDSARDAFRIVFHENLHAVNQLGRTMGQSEAALQDPANRALEEGLTELYARRNLNAYLQKLGVAELVPGILTANDYCEGTYPHFVPAVEVLAEGLSRRTGFSENEILRRLVTIDCETRWQVVGDLLFEAEGLHHLVPEADHAGVKDRLTAAMRQPFAQLVDLDGSIDQIIVASTTAGYDALGSFDREVEALRLEHDRTRGPAQLLDSILERQEHAALAVTGAHHITQISGSVADFTLADGSTVEEVLRKMCERAGEENQPYEDLAQYKEALHVLLEHDIYQSAGRFREVGMGDVPLDRGTVVFSEGLARALSDDRLNAYVDQLGLEPIAPGLRDTASPRRLDPGAVAARAFVQEIGREIQVPVKGQGNTGNGEQPAYVEMDRDVLLRQLAGVDPELPWLRVTDLVYGSQAFPRLSGLGGHSRGQRHHPAVDDGGLRAGRRTGGVRPVPAFVGRKARSRGRTGRP
ncbi:hypothetical protein [Kribbella kalugense]|uniref:Uncharacterized protein n=1 Tax=Kribbella kalugense TaxID=2512221 RepID=A0A4R7ZWD8_9ACTN|nr:hypothetical protein [Kribbella kalugense]TDW22399.1 hypothetical protein EV650_1236 [Kribbella kalugense]